MVDGKQSSDGNSRKNSRDPDTPSMENVWDLLRLTRPPLVVESVLENIEGLDLLSDEITKELARDVRSLLIDHQFEDGGSFEVEDVRRLGFDICNDSQALIKLMAIAKSSCITGSPRIVDLIRARDDADYELTRRELTDDAYGRMRWIEIIDEDDLHQMRTSDDPNDNRNLQKFARLIVSPAMTQLLIAMQKTVERAGQKFPFKEAMVLAWNRARALDREQAAVDMGEADATERRRRLLGSSVMEEAQREIISRTEHEMDTLPQHLPPIDEG